MDRTITIPNTLSGPTTVKGIEGSVTFSFDSSNLDDEQLAALIEKKVFKLLCDNARSKYFYNDSEIGLAMREQAKGGIVEIDLAEFQERRTAKRKKLEDMTPEERIAEVERIMATLTPEQREALNQKL